jgi:hypothetical protein
MNFLVFLALMFMGGCVIGSGIMLIYACIYLYISDKKDINSFTTLITGLVLGLFMIFVGTMSCYFLYIK